MKYQLNLKVNGRIYDLEVEPHRTLLEVLKEDLGLTGAKRGCETNLCGAYTILLDGKAVHSCSILAVMANNKEITTNWEFLWRRSPLQRVTLILHLLTGVVWQVGLLITWEML